MQVLSVILTTFSVLLAHVDFVTQPLGFSSGAIFAILAMISAVVVHRTRKTLAVVFEGVFTAWSALWCLFGTLVPNITHISNRQAIILTAVMLVPLIASYVLFRSLWSEQWNEQVNRFFGRRP